MAKVHDALKRIERERQEQVLAASGAPRNAARGVQGGPFWVRWFARRSRPAQQPSSADARVLERVAARLDALEMRLSDTAADRAGSALLERTEMIASRLDSLEARMSTAMPSAEHLLHAIEGRMAALERDLATRLSEATDFLGARTALLSTRITVLLVVVALALLAILFRC